MPLKMKVSLTYLTLLLVILTGNARATTVVAPTFDQLVDEAEVIFQGKVTAVRSQWTGEGAQRVIVTFITFSVEDSLKGNPGQSYTIRMVGGTVDGETLEIADAPRFAVGNRDVLFVEHNGSQFIPLVGIMHGRFHVKRDQFGRESVTTNEGKILTDLPQFKAAIRQKIQYAR
jgi:hypothetical protein